MNSAIRNAALVAALALLGCSAPSEVAPSNGRLGFVGATSTPTQMTMSPAGCAASYLFDNMVANLRGVPVSRPRPGDGGVYVPGTTYTTEGPPRPGAAHVVGVFTAPSSIAGKPISITVRGFIAAAGGTTRVSFAGQQSQAWTDSATEAEPSLATTHEFVTPAVAGENRFELDIGLPLEGNDPANANLRIDSVDFRVGDVEGCGPDIERYEQEHPRAN